MAYGIMRVEKRRRGAVYGLQREACRTRDQHEKGLELDGSDVDWTRTDDNYRLAGTDAWNARVSEIIKASGVRERSDSVVMLDAVYTASKDFFDSLDADAAKAYFRNCLAAHQAIYCGGDASLIVSAVVHMDEETPHMHVQSVPIIKDERGLHLSAKIVMGSRADYHARQDDFYRMVSQHWGLERGEVREPSQRRAHTAQRDWQEAQQRERLDAQARQIAEQERAIDRLEASRQHAERQGDAIRRRAESEQRRLMELHEQYTAAVKIVDTDGLDVERIRKHGRELVQMPAEDYERLTRAVKASAQAERTAKAERDAAERRAAEAEARAGDVMAAQIEAKRWQARYISIPEDIRQQYEHGQAVSRTHGHGRGL